MGKNRAEFTYGKFTNLIKQESQAGKFSAQAIFALIYCGLILTVLEYFFLPGRVEAWLSGQGFYQWKAPSLEAGIIWAVACLVGLIAIPLVFHKFIFSGNIREIGFSLHGFFRHMPTYLILFVFMLPFIYWASTEPAFISRYPFIPEARTSRSSFLLWEIFYLSQFFAVEAFFRGYLLFTMRKYTDQWMAIAICVVPYVMIHFHKPFPEALGSIFAGIALGWLALRNASWLGGALLHILVALSMDLLSVTASGLF